VSSPPLFSSAAHQSSRRQLYLIDGTSYIYRAFFALPHLSNSRGVSTNAIYGFTNMLLRLLREQAPAYLGVVFDAGGETERHREFAEYKAKRPPMPDTLAPQIPYIYQMLEAMHIPTLMEEGYEADDIIGTVALRAADEGFQVIIVTGDKDFLQLVGPTIQVYDSMRDRAYGIREVEERYGVPPQAVVELMSLTGDPIDNIPGVPGIGEKTASSLIKEFGTAENLLNHLDRVRQPRLREALKAHAGQIRRNRSLVTIRIDLPLPLSCEALRRQEPDRERLQALFRELEFTRLLPPVEGAGRNTP